MSDYPDRAERKQEIKVLIDCRLKKSITELAESFGQSKSATIECIIFLVKGEYESAQAESLIERLRSYKIDRYQDNTSFSEYPPQSHWHLTLDRDALRFCSMLEHKYPLVFDNRSMTICLCLAHANRICKTDNAREHFLKRLKDVLNLHPVRKLGSKPQETSPDKEA